jgi:DNA-binding IclR family transcriptional regulator
MECLNQNGQMELQDIDARIELAKSTIHAQLDTLCQLGLVVKQDATYKLSLQLFEFGIRSRENNRFYSLAKDFVDELALQTGETVWLDAFERGHAVVIYKAEGESLLQSYADLGMHIRLHQSAGGRAILAALPDERVERYIESTIADDESELGERIRDEVEDIRSLGYATEYADAIDVNAIGSWVSGTEDVLGSVVITGSAERLTRQQMIERQLPEQLIEATNEIELKLNRFYS